MKRSLVLGGVLLALAAGGPISLCRLGDYWRNLKSGSSDAATASAGGESLSPSDPALPAGARPAVAAAGLPIEGAPVKQLSDVFRFDVSPTWVLERWPRVSTDLSPLELRGYRVPLVTGTQLTDLAGALTYYFNPAQQVHRITFLGKTGDPRALAELLMKQYHFVRRPLNDPGRLLYESLQSSGRPAGRMTITSAPVIRANRPFERYNVELQIERPE
ncbi:MAG: hypothetical protein JXB10_02880 [Pirellulales bacterium]|nr:hypothetical protein [Pirellulales bacterium]